MSRGDNVKDMREAGNAAVEVEDYEKAVKIYSDALLINDIPEEEQGLLHSNRSYACLQLAINFKDSDGEKMALALQDANDVIKLRPTWWKGYFRAGEVFKFKKDYNRAIECFNEALALDPELVDVTNSRDECRFDKVQAEMKRFAIPHGIKEEVDEYNKAHGTNIDAEAVIQKYQELMKSKNPKLRARACVFFGTRYVRGVDVPKDVNKGVEILHGAVNAGSPEAMVELGVLYMQGEGVRRNIKKAVGLYEKAAQCESKNKNSLDDVTSRDGVTHAQFHIGLCFENGTGKTLDYYQARRWYEKASERGHAGAANNLAILYEEGYGGKKCSVRAKQYFSLSASRGNVAAMESLAWKCLEEREFEQAENWYARALESGNDHSIQNKEKFYMVLEGCRSSNLKLNDQFRTPLDSFSTSKPDPETKEVLPAEMMNLVEAIERVTINKPSIVQAVELGDSPLSQYWKDFEEIQKRAENGHPFAQTLLLSMGYFAEGKTNLKKLGTMNMHHKDYANTQEQCIHNFANCFRATEIIAFFEPSELPRISKICKNNISNRRSDLDLAARIVYCFMQTASHNSEMFSFSNICCKMYPDEMFFYKMHAAAYAVRQNFEASMKVSDQGLKKFPTNESLLYCKAGAMKMIKSCRDDQVIAAYKEFIKHAPFDERMIPEAYYNMAFYASDEEKSMYYAKGQEAELQMLPCLLPYKSNMKSLLDAFMVFEKKDKNGQPIGIAKPAEQPVKSSAALTKLQLTNPARVQFVQRHRQTLKDTTKLFQKNFVVNMSFETPKEQKLSVHPAGFKDITLRDMNPHKDEVYKERYINLLISEDPMFGLFTAIHVVVRDDNGDCINCSFYDLDHFDDEVRRNLCFGSMITVLNPYYRLASDGSVALRVDDPKTIMYRASGKENSICRYCWKENPQHSCGSCKRAKYCNRTCLTDDRKNLKHHLICGLKYFDDM